jgi:apolipoprotein N-acyltransferase
MLLLLILSILSYYTYSTYEETGDKMHIVAIQPNIDPYNEKFHGIPESDQIDRMIQLTLDQTKNETSLVLWPETAFPTPCWEHEFEYLYGVEEIRKVIDQYPNVRLITGLLSTRLYLDQRELSPTSRKFRHGVGWFDNYNSAIEVEDSETIDLHHKSKLVLGVEKVPFLKHLPIMKKLSINLGGSSGGYGEDGSPTVFFNKEDKQGVGPIICYESVYGEYVTEYVRKGAELLAIITNDGWWDDTPGYKQHLAYARLRAIETRRSIGRSANTGISGFINQRGDVFNTTDWWVEDSVSAELHLNDGITFYTQYGDFIGRTMAFLAPLLLLLAFVRSRNKTQQRLDI